VRDGFMGVIEITPDRARDTGHSITGLVSFTGPLFLFQRSSAWMRDMPRRLREFWGA